MNVETLKSKIGTPANPGDWIIVTQEMINQFADLTGDHQWIHVDEERCRKESPYGSTIAHGMLVQSIIPKLIGDGNNWMEGFSAGINYGSDKVRFTSPVRAGARIRGSGQIKEVTELDNGAVRVVNAITVEIEGEDKPACYAELVGLLYP